jgi:hypothetical protein
MAALAVALTAPAPAVASSGRSVASSSDVRRAGPVSPAPPARLLPFTGLDALLMVSGCLVLLLFGAGLRAFPRTRPRPESAA